MLVGAGRGGGEGKDEHLERGGLHHGVNTRGVTIVYCI
jgi:hypothetical protein